MQIEFEYDKNGVALEQHRIALEQNWNRIGIELEQNWNRIGIELEQNWNRIGIALESIEFQQNVNRM